MKVQEYQCNDADTHQSIRIIPSDNIAPLAAIKTVTFGRFTEV